MATVYTVRMAALKGLAGRAANLTPPAGTRWIVRDIDIFIGNQVGSTMVYAFDAQTGINFFACQANEEVQSWFQWNGRHVIDNPSSLCFQVNGGNADISASGYQLSLP